MAGFPRMHEIGRRAGGGHGRGDLARHMARFAHAGDDGAPGGGANQSHRCIERAAKRAGVGHRRFNCGYALPLQTQRAQAGEGGGTIGLGSH